MSPVPTSSSPARALQPEQPQADIAPAPQQIERLELTRWRHQQEHERDLVALEGSAVVPAGIVSGFVCCVGSVTGGAFLAATSIGSGLNAGLGMASVVGGLGCGLWAGRSAIKIAFNRGRQIEMIEDGLGVAATEPEEARTDSLLKQALHPWLEEPRIRSLPEQEWHFGASERAKAFGAWLQRVRVSSHFTDPATRAQTLGLVQDLIEAMDDPAMRERVFTVAVAAYDHDSVRLPAIEDLLRTWRLERGQVNEDDLLNSGLIEFRLSELADHVCQHHGLDPSTADAQSLAVLRSYEKHLQQRLGLPAALTRGNYDQSLSDLELAAAARHVEAREAVAVRPSLLQYQRYVSHIASDGAGFPGKLFLHPAAAFLAQRFEPWRQRIAASRRHEIDDLKTGVQASLAKLEAARPSLVGDEYERNLGALEFIRDYGVAYEAALKRLDARASQ